jgi:hypothetical protein
MEALGFQKTFAESGTINLSPQPTDQGVMHRHKVPKTQPQPTFSLLTVPRQEKLRPETAHRAKSSTGRSRLPGSRNCPPGKAHRFNLCVFQRKAGKRFPGILNIEDTPMSTYFTIEERLTRYQTGLTNARSVPEFTSRVSTYGYDADKLDALLDQCEAVLNNHINQQKEYSEQHAATQAFETARKAADVSFQKTGGNFRSLC